MTDRPPDFLDGTIVPNALLPKIGRISVLFSYLDIEVNIAIWDLLDASEPMGLAVTQSIRNFSDRIILLRKLSEIARPGHEGRIKEIVTHLGTAADDRNRLIHDQFWSGTETPPAVNVARQEPMGTPKLYLFDKEALDDLTHRLARLREFVGWLRLDDPWWLSEPLPSLDKSPTQRLRMAGRTPPSNSNKPKRPPPS